MSLSVFSGTHVAGILTAIGSNDQGIIGMLGDSNFCLIVARVLDDNGEGLWSDIFDGIRWVIDQGAQVINVSIDGGMTYQTSVNEYFRSVYEDMGRLVVAAAGNDGTRYVPL